MPATEIAVGSSNSPAITNETAPAVASNEVVSAGDTNVTVTTATTTQVVETISTNQTTGTTDTNALATTVTTTQVVEVVSTNTTESASIPLIQFSDVPITTAIENLARQAGINYLLDPKIAYGQPDANGQIKPEPTLSIRWEKYHRATRPSRAVGQL
ncbi:MAG: hypothetical protein WDM76_01760 [Limisphaerales bacterium]